MKLTRRTFVGASATVLAATAVGAPVFAAQRVPLTGQEPVFATPEEALQLLLQVQHAELALYSHMAEIEGEGPLAGLLQGMIAIEQSHVDALSAWPGIVVPELAEYAFEGADVTTLLVAAADLESASVSCMQVLGGTLQSTPKALNLALGIHENDARQLAIVQAQRGEVPVPLAVHPTLPLEAIDQVLAAYVV